MNTLDDGSVLISHRTSVISLVMILTGNLYGISGNITQHHPNGRYYLWMDLASSHFANNTLDLLRQEGIRFVPKEDNPPCVAFLRPIEDFWSALKKSVYDGGWEANSLAALKRRIRLKARQFPLPTVLRLFNTIKDRLATCARDGYWSIHR